MQVQTGSERRGRLIALARKFWIGMPQSINDCRSSSEEDLWEFLHGDTPIERWASVTLHPDDRNIHYIKTFSDRESAEAHCIEYVTDDIFAEVPVAVVDLDAERDPWGALYPVVRLIPEFETHLEPLGPAEMEEYLERNAGLLHQVGCIMLDRREADDEAPLIWEWLYEHQGELYDDFGKIIDDIEVACFG